MGARCNIFSSFIVHHNDAGAARVYICSEHYPPGHNGTAAHDEHDAEALDLAHLGNSYQHLEGRHNGHLETQHDGYFETQHDGYFETQRDEHLEG
jgi:hypothetical protein